MNRTIRRILVAGSVPLIALTLAACGDSNHSDMPGMDRSGAPSVDAAADHSTADVEFAQMMIAHHQQALDMSTLAETRAQDAELKTLAAQIKAAQDPEISTMTGWLTSWGQPTAQPGGHNMPGMGGMPGMMSDDEMTQLRAGAGTDFDRMYARMMIAHHNGAIQMANDILGSTSNAQVKALAEQVVASQATEVTQLQSILDRL